MVCEEKIGLKQQSFTNKSCSARLTLRCTESLWVQSHPDNHCALEMALGAVRTELCQQSSSFLLHQLVGWALHSEDWKPPIQYTRPQVPARGQHIVNHPLPENQSCPIRSYGPLLGPEPSRGSLPHSEVFFFHLASHGQKTKLNLRFKQHKRCSVAREHRSRNFVHK